MNFKSRIKRIERKFNIGNTGLLFERLFEPNFVYKGKPFENIDEMYKKLNIVNIPSDLTDKEAIVLLEKRLISISSLFAQDLMEKACKEMKRMM